jgi:hypothetical protein
MILPPNLPPYLFVFLELAFKVILYLVIEESQRIFRSSRFLRGSLGSREIAHLSIHHKVIGILHEQ